MEGPADRETRQEVPGRDAQRAGQVIHKLLHVAFCPVSLLSLHLPFTFITLLSSFFGLQSITAIVKNKRS